MGLHQIDDRSNSDADASATEPTPSARRQPGKRDRSGRRWLVVPFSAVVGPLGRLFGGSGSALGHQATNTLGHRATEALGHEAATAAGALGHNAVSAGAGGGAASGAAGAAPPPPGGPGPAVAIGAGAAAVVAIAAVVVANTGGPPPEEAAPTTTAAPTTAAPVVEPPQAGPQQFAADPTRPLAGNLFDGAIPGSTGGPLEVVAVAGETAQVGAPVALPSGAVVTVAADGTFSYDPAIAFVGLAPGETAVDSFTYAVGDGTGWRGEWTAAVTVTGAAYELVAPDPLSLQVESTATAEIVADPDAGPFVFTAEASAPAFVTVETTSATTATVTAAPGADAAGDYEVVVVAAFAAAPDVPVATTTVSITVTEAPAPARVVSGLVALYTFDLDDGEAVVSDEAGDGVATDLTATGGALSRGDEGLTLTAPTVLVGDGSSISAAAVASGGITLEAWATPSASQDGPARVVSLSTDTSLRNVTLAQGGEVGTGDGAQWTARLRSTETSVNGLPELTTPSGSAVAGQLTHVVLVAEAGGTTTLYVDGVAVASAPTTGDFTNWDTSYPLVVGNELTGDRPWLGTLHLVAVYGRALSGGEVAQNHSVGATP